MVSSNNASRTFSILTLQPIDGRLNLVHALKGECPTSKKAQSARLTVTQLWWVLWKSKLTGYISWWLFSITKAICWSLKSTNHSVQSISILVIHTSVLLDFSAVVSALSQLYVEQNCTFTVNMCSEHILLLPSEDGATTLFKILTLFPFTMLEWGIHPDSDLALHRINSLYISNITVDVTSHLDTQLHCLFD